MNFSVKRRIEGQYTRLIQQLMDKVMIATQGMTDVEIIQYLRGVSESAEFTRLAELAASRMVGVVQREHDRTWRSAARKGTQSKVIYRALRGELGGSMDAVMRSIVDRNSMLIKTLPRDIARNVSRKALEDYQKGIRIESLAEEIQKQVPKMSARHARLIARTETSKANEAMVEARARDIGAEWYIWRSSHDERVRNSHNRMDGVVVHWDDAPNPEMLNNEKNAFGPYHAGCCPNCRCYPEPIVHYSQLPDAFEVHQHGRLVRMTRGKFLNEFGIAA